MITGDALRVLADETLRDTYQEAKRRLELGRPLSPYQTRVLLTYSEALENSLDTDLLTGALNHRGLTNTLNQELKRIGNHEQEYRMDTALTYVDADRFKSINDQYDHLTGDKLLVELSQYLRRNVKAGDDVARIGGDEFALLLYRSGESTEGLVQRLNKIMKDISVDPIIRAIDPKGIVGLSIGVTLLEPGVSAADHMKRADDALYHSKLHAKCHEPPKAEVWQPTAINYERIRQEVDRAGR
jgi:diguanylate cyclase (GGDEF)-like protein